MIQVTLNVTGWLVLSVVGFIFKSETTDVQGFSHISCRGWCGKERLSRWMQPGL